MRPDRAHLTLLAAVTSVALLLLSGLGFAVYFAVADDPTTTPTTTAPAAPRGWGVMVRVMGGVWVWVWVGVWVWVWV